MEKRLELQLELAKIQLETALSIIDRLSVEVPPEIQNKIQALHNCIKYSQELDEIMEDYYES